MKLNEIIATPAKRFRRQNWNGGLFIERTDKGFAFKTDHPDSKVWVEEVRNSGGLFEEFANVSEIREAFDAYCDEEWEIYEPTYIEEGGTN